MRKHKSVVAILLAVMMIFTFMPTMAFADDPVVEWSADYSYVTVDGVRNDNFKVTRTFDSATGKVVAEASAEQVAGLNPPDSAAYYDLSNADFGVGPADAGKKIVSEYTNPSYYTKVEGHTNNNAGLYFNAPSYVTNKDAASKYVTFATLNYGAWQGKTVGDKDFDSKATEDQSFTLTLDVSYTAQAIDNTKLFVGAKSDKVVNIKGKETSDPDDAAFYIDEVKKGAGSTTGLDVDYDGEEHTVVMGTLKGYSVKYTVYNTKTGAWDPTEVVTVKEAGETKSVTATLYDSEGKKAKDEYGDVYEWRFNVVVNAVTRAQVVFDEDGDGGPYTYKVNKGSLFDPTDFLKVEAVSYVEGRYRERSGILYPWSNLTHTVTDADKAAVAANKDEIKAWFKDYYEIEQSSTKANPDEVILTIKEKDLSKLSDKEREALDKKYEDLFSKFVSETYQQTGSGPKTHWQDIKGIVVDTDQTGTINFVSTEVVNDKDDDITFSGVTTKSFKAKKKTKKLASTKTFQVAAVADSGNVITFSATSSNAKVSIDATGKVTVKKGLKKGAKVKLVVKAKTAAGNGYKAASAEKTYTIKIK